MYLSKVPRIKNQETKSSIILTTSCTRKRLHALYSNYFDLEKRNSYFHFSVSSRICIEFLKKRLKEVYQDGRIRKLIFKDRRSWSCSEWKSTLPGGIKETRDSASEEKMDREGREQDQNRYAIDSGCRVEFYI